MSDIELRWELPRRFHRGDVVMLSDKWWKNANRNKRSPYEKPAIVTGFGRHYTDSVVIKFFHRNCKDQYHHSFLTHVQH